MINHVKFILCHRRSLTGRKVLTYLLVIIVVILVGCTRATPTPDQSLEQPVVTTSLPKHFLPSIFAQREADSSVQTTSEPGQPSATELYTPTSTDTPIPSTDTPTPCSPPTDWVAYTVQSGDTLYSLAQKTNTTVDEIQRANCMAGATTIIVGQVLYLPILPPTNTPVPPTNTPLPPTNTDTPKPAEPTPTNTPDRPEIVLAPGGGNNPDFTPCEFEIGSPWIDVDEDHIEVGERRYFFACEFEDKIDSAFVTMSNGQIEPLDILSSMPNPILQQGNATALVAWSALPIHPFSQSGEQYSLTFTDSNGSDTTRTFWIEQPTRAYILAVPPVKGPGSSFDIYYVNFGINTNLNIEMYQEVSFDGKQYTFAYISEWEVTVNNALPNGNGWVMRPLQLNASSPILAYLVHYQLQAYSIFWLE